MNNFATILKLISFRKVNYYTVQLEYEEDDLFDKFIKNCAAFKDELNEIRSWIQKIGEEYGAEEKWFRFEAFGKGDARACLLYTSPSPRDATLSRMPSSA